MNVSRLETRGWPRAIEHIREFLKGTAEVAFSPPADEAARRMWVATVLKRYRYVGLPKGSRGVLFAYLQRLTGYSRQHLSRLIAQYRSTQSLKPRKRFSRTRFARKYDPQDVALLAEIDSLHDTLSGPATPVLLIRAATLFGDARHARLYNLRLAQLQRLPLERAPYRKQRQVWQRTRPSPVAIGIRNAPAPQGLPGYLWSFDHIRIDTVHQGDQDGLKGLTTSTPSILLPSGNSSPPWSVLAKPIWCR